MARVKAKKRREEEVVEEEAEEKPERGKEESGEEGFSLAERFPNVQDKILPITIVVAVILFLVLRLMIPMGLLTLLFNLIIGASVLFLFLLTFRDIADFKKNRMNLVPVVTGLLLLLVAFHSGLSSDPLLITMLSAYFVLSVMFASRMMKLQLAIIIALFATGFLYRVYPAFPDANPHGFFLSMDDPYYHYKQTERIYRTGDNPDIDFLIYPPEGRGAPKKFPYYYNAYLAHLTGLSLHDVIMLYPVIISALGAVFAFLFMKELSNDWKVGVLAGFFFATMPMLLTKSVAGGIEEDIMGMVMGLFSLYLLAKAIKSEGRRNTLFSILCGVSFLITILSWKGSNFLFAVPFMGLAVYLYFGSLLDYDNWKVTRLVFISGLIAVAGKFTILDKLRSIEMAYIAPFAMAVLVGLWAESVRTRVKDKKDALYILHLIVGFFALVAITYALLIDPNVGALLVGIVTLLGVITMTNLMVILPKRIPLAIASLALIILAFVLSFTIDMLTTTGILMIVLALINLVAFLLSFVAHHSKGKLSLQSFKSKPEDSIRDVLPLISSLLLLVFIASSLDIGIEKIAGTPTAAFEEFAGKSAGNYLVDKTIQEQAALAGGDLWGKIERVFPRYNIGMIFSIVASILTIIPLAYYLLFKKKDQFFVGLRSYIIALFFFLTTMTFVWVEARLGFSQSLGFILLGSMIGILLPNSRKELISWKFIALLVIPILLLFFTLYPERIPGMGEVDTWSATKMGSSVYPDWVEGIEWLGENVPKGPSDDPLKGDYVLTWWDYGHAITALARTPVIADPLQAGENYIMRIAHFFYNTSSEEEAMEWLMDQPWNRDAEGNGKKVRYIILDKTLIDKASALAFLGTNYYEYPNGEKPVNGTCSVGVPCVNKEIGVEAILDKDGKYHCEQGVLCLNPNFATDKQMCCDPDACCNKSLSWEDVGDKGGQPVRVRSPSEPVYGQYQLNTDPNTAICKSYYKTSIKTSPPIVESGETRTVVRSFLYTGFSGLPYGDGVSYHAFVVLDFADGEQSIRLLGQNCVEGDYQEIMQNYDDSLIRMEFGVRLSDEIVAPQIFIHIPEKWQHNMFTELYLKNAADLKYFELIYNDETKEFYPFIKIYKITYPDELEAEPATTGVKAGDAVKVEYTGRFEDGEVFDSSEGREPLEFTAGVGQMIEGFDEAVIGMALGEEKTVTIPPEKAYGLANESDNPLAGETLVFDIKVVGINEQELGEETGETPEESSEPGEELEEEPEENLAVNYDVYDPTLIDVYGITQIPTLVWDCVAKKSGQLSSGEVKTISCLLNKAEPEEVCGSEGISIIDGKLSASSDQKDLLDSLDRTGQDSCKTDGVLSLYAFHGPDCPDCEAQREALYEVSGDFGESLNITFYCSGDSVRCSKESRITI
ncbi:MAG: FKBP-type peptidyl-prolyl cis-trans isomerase [Candidatus Altiarchaeota archaeon]|nr:FKBP-type peptidyl-prolyl cis-trans isomerase [Candidatus Altiarchaeota archaeon]